MSLVTEFQARYSAARIVELTRADNADASTASSTMLTTAATDAEADFVDLVGLDLDLTEPRHVRVAVLLMEAILVEYGAGLTPEAEALRKKAEARALALRKTTSRDRAAPTTSSPLDPTEERSGSRPAFDRSHFDQMVPNPPLGADEGSGLIEGP